MILLFNNSQAETPDDREVHDLERLILAETRSHRSNRPWLFTNMVTSLDGASNKNGLSAGLSNSVDRQLLKTFRLCADLVIVGSRTATLEQYQLPTLSNKMALKRPSDCGKDHPRLGVISTSLDLDLTLPFLADRHPQATKLPIIFTTEAAIHSTQSETFRDKAELVAVGDERPDMALVVAWSQENHYRTILSEGGPTINKELASQDLIDEWNLTISNQLAGHGELSQTNAPALEAPSANRPENDDEHEPGNFELNRLMLDPASGALFGRWLRGQNQPDQLGQSNS